MADPTPTDTATLEVLQANVALLAEKERLERERARLLEQDRARTEFLARISHDLRTPLNSIIGFSDLLLAGDGGKLPRKSLDYLQAIHRNGHALLGLINDLLDLSGMELGRLTVRPGPIDLREFLADVRAATDPLLARSVLSVTWPRPDQITGVTFHGDRRRLLQVMTNLLDNARKFTPSGGRLEVTMAPDDGGVVLGVADDGPGDPEQVRLTMTRPAGAPARHEGTGLGLAIVKTIVDLHGGRITVERGLTGRGCAFRIRLPAAGATL